MSKFKVGDVVRRTDKGPGHDREWTVVHIGAGNCCTCHQRGFDGHSGNMGDDSKVEYWFIAEKDLTLVYREPPSTEDVVNRPSHYAIFKDIEAKDIIGIVLDYYENDLNGFEAYCLGNILKYRLRAGSKDDALQDIAKANRYKEMGESDC